MARPDVIIDLPLFNTAAERLRNTGVFQQNLTNEDVAGIMSSVAGSLVAAREDVSAKIAHMSVGIEKQQGRVSGLVVVERPLSAKISLDCVLANDNVPGRIKLASLKVDEDAGWVQRGILMALNIKGRAKKALGDPNSAFEKALATQLEPRGVRLTKVALQFNDRTLAIDLMGRPI
ncbi:hypothetical protein HYU94_03910 [Candidatus Daviesbacteria bacterium]|nr:hypothetical protein [Candidatus Daviesbacteria bacterium]